MHKSTLRMVLGSAVALAGLWVTEPSARAQQTRFDVQNFRPTPGPRDLVIVPQSQPLAHLSGALGAYFSFALDPLVLLNSDGNRSLDVVKNRFQLDLMGAMGLGGWFELGVVLPVILYQSSGNLEPLGTEGEVRSTVIGDLSLIGKLPFVRRQSYASGFGVALMTRVNAPTGVQEAFASDGTWTVNPTLVTDYRFGMGALISLQAGMNIRPTSEFFDVKLGPTFTGAGGAEMPLVRRWGLTMLGGVSALRPGSHISVTMLFDSASAPWRHRLFWLRDIALAWLQVGARPAHLELQGREGHCRIGLQADPTRRAQVTLAITDLIIDYAGSVIDTAVEGALGEKLASLRAEDGGSQCAQAVATHLGISAKTFGKGVDAVLDQTVPLGSVGRIKLRTALCGPTGDIWIDSGMARLGQLLDQPVDLPEEGPSTVRQAMCTPKNQGGDNALKGTLFELVRIQGGAEIVSQLPAFIKDEPLASRKLTTEVAKKVADRLYDMLNLKGLCG